MIQKLLEYPRINFKWIDVELPSDVELHEIALEYSLHPKTVEDCLQPDHLQKFERIGDVTFIITRAFDIASMPDSDTVRKLTHKIAIFFGKEFIITIHRTRYDFLQAISDKWFGKDITDTNIPFQILADVFNEIIMSYEKPINDAQNALESYEEEIFSGGQEPPIIHELYFLKRKASVYLRMMHLSLDILGRFNATSEHNAPFLQDLKDSAARMYFIADQLLDNVNNVMNLHISLASQRTNNVVRVLTLFSVFFLPLTFIAGLYGMNFLHMPELKFRYGYPLVLLFMILVIFCIFLWFRRKGWLK